MKVPLKGINTDVYARLCLPNSVSKSPLNKTISEWLCKYCFILVQPIYALLPTWKIKEVALN